MEFVSKLRWVMVVFISLLLLVLVGWGLATIARGLFDDNSSSGSVPGEQDIALQALGADSVRYIVDGPVVASADHRSYMIEVTENVVVMRVFADYGQTVISEKSYRNNDVAYQTFVESLDNLNASARTRGTTVDDDVLEAGVCSAGRRHIVEVGDDVRRWRTNCEAFPGTAGGDMRAIRLLFSAQIPDFRDMIKGTGLI